MKTTQGLIGKKIGMHQIFTSEGKVIPITLVKVEPNVVTQVKTIAKDGYESLQLASGFKRKNIIKKPILGHLLKAKTENKSFLSEFRNMKDLVLGDKVDVSIFKAGDYVDIQAFSKGKGTAGVIKRHNFSRGPMSHGSKHHRAPGSIGISRPDKVWKGQPLPGRKGNAKVTLQNLEIIKVDSSENLLFVKGSFPGNVDVFCKIYHSIKKKNHKKSISLYNFVDQKKDNKPKPQKIVTLKQNQDKDKNINEKESK